MFDGLYLTVDGGINRGVAVIGSIYPACWALEPDDFDKQVWRVAWPNAPLLVGIADNGSRKLGTVVELSNRYPFEPSCRWRLARCPPSVSDQSRDAPTRCARSPSISSLDTVVDAVGEEESGTITTTRTTTTSTTVTKVVRVSSA
ncbi:hypothetical protein BD779DRAFT_1536025 [Infundibulicybe gibba]|nr:hypothetical protein BD779DRAFT_1536025 [Infundibulicybe gibba]